MKDRAPEADLVLQKALALDSKNPFTMNNLGFAREKEGEFQDAMKYYNTAAASGSNEPVVVTLNRDWRGKPISEVASENARKLQRLISRTEDTRSQVARLNLRGVSAINRNEKRKAREYFEHAYKLDESNAFTLNNMGYLAELDGDRETADYYYAKAREADLKDARVTVATRRDAEGQKVGEVADVNGQIVNEAFRDGKVDPSCCAAETILRSSIRQRRSRPQPATSSNNQRLRRIRRRRRNRLRKNNNKEAKRHRASEVL
jgi:tetratricopeptide (TPR) repeat protein